MPHFYEQIRDELQREPGFVLGIISGVKGSSPQKLGAKALFFPGDRIVGTLGGGCLEAEIRLRARRALATREPATFEMTLDHDFGWDDGLICGGTVSGLILPKAAEAAEIWRVLASRDQPRTWGVRKNFSIGWVEDAGVHASACSEDWLYQETVLPPTNLWIAGSGHIAQAVAPLAQTLDFNVTIFDDRPELANFEYFPKTTHLRVGHWGELLAMPLPPQPTMGLIVTRGHQHDANVLAEWIHNPFQFLGMIGSRRKSRIIREGFIKRKVATVEQLDKLASPVGLDINAATVPEIAVSILAQYIQKRAEYSNSASSKKA